MCGRHVPLALLTEERGRGYAAGIHRVEDDPRRVMQAPVQLKDSHHVQRLGILVRLGTIELGAVDHLLTWPCLQSRQLAHVRNRLHEGSRDRVLVASDRAHNAHARVLGLLDCGQQELHEQKVAQMVDLQVSQYASR